VGSYMCVPPDEVRPLLAGVVRWDDDGAAVEIGMEEVRVLGDPELLRSILGDCDGRLALRSIAERHGPEARGLIESLFERGAVVNGSEAWRVLHRQSSVGTALGQPIDDDELAVLERGSFAAGRPTGPRVALEPQSNTTGQLAVRRRSALPGEPSTPATFASLSSILAATYGMTSEAGETRSGTVPSAGALYPLALHVLLREPLPPADRGLWRHDPTSLTLGQLAGQPGDVDELFVAEPGCTALLARRQPILFLSADLERPSRKYGARAYRYGLMEAGAAMQAAYLTATELGVPIRAIGGIDDGAVHRFLQLPEAAVPLLAILIGT
jgi:SagB-type dehydrogenase family enzyme